MAKVDLHVHSKFSHHASEWFLKKLGAHESYTEPELVFRKALAQGMNFVTLTDHNQIEGAQLLLKQYPKQVFTGSELTAYFPEDGCKVHVLVYGITEQEFQDLNQLRQNIYELRDYIKKKYIAHSVAHATYAVNGRLQQSTLEKLILLFDIFEGINGSRDEYLNNSWQKILASLTPKKIDYLQQRYGIEPFSQDAWVKGMTAGSDDHAGLFVGRTYTEIGARTVEEFLEQLKNKMTLAKGRHNNYQTFAFTIYKIAYDFSKQKKTVSNSLISQLNEFVFNNSDISFAQRIKLGLVQKRKQQGVDAEFYDLIQRIKEGKEKDFEEKLKIVYSKISDITDAFLKILFESLEKDLGRGNLFKLARDVSSLIPCAFLAAPFFSSLSHLFRGRTMINTMKRRYLTKEENNKKRIIWFTDTLTDLNGVSESIKNMGFAACEQGMDLLLAAVVPDSDQDDKLPSNLIRLPSFHSIKLPYYEKLSLRIPSVLKAVEMIYQAKPDEMMISTPGPIGLLGLLLGKLLNIKCTGIYHTDFTAQIRALSGAEDLVELTQQYIKWFYSAMHGIKVPTRAYLDILRERGYKTGKLSLYRKSVDVDLFQPQQELGQRIRQQLAYPNYFTCLYVGRISQDKNIDLLVDIYKVLQHEKVNINLLIVGDGPALVALENRAKNYPTIMVMGKKHQQALPALYSMADLLLFPSQTDTFGMVVLEAQACGLPALVTNSGGPKEIVIDHKTGLVLSDLTANAWAEAIKQMKLIKQNNVEKMVTMRRQARQRVLDQYSIKHTLSDLFQLSLDDQTFSDSKKKLTPIC